MKCWYGSHGVDMDSKDAEMLTWRSYFYSNSNIPCVHIGETKHELCSVFLQLCFFWTDHATEGALVELASQVDVERPIPQASSR